MKYLFYLGHPAHYHLFKEIIKILNKNNSVIIFIKKKDVLEELLKNEGWDYFNVYPKERKVGKFSIALSLLIRETSIFKKIYNNIPKLMIGTSAEITHLGKLLRVASVVVNEDDAEQVPLFSKLAYPFANSILAPSSCSTSKW
ncbi:MAG: hypothetical protein Q7R95_07205, partial [bacterium]|nr:hypothetical protein [bacterium]